jgi:hypothetical protein
MVKLRVNVDVDDSVEIRPTEGGVVYGEGLGGHVPPVYRKFVMVVDNERCTTGNVIADH